MAEPDNRSVRLLGLLAVVAAAVIAVVLVVRDDEDPDAVETDAASGGAVEPSYSQAAADSATIPRRQFTLAATGDILVHESVARAASPRGDAAGVDFDFGAMFDLVRPAISGADVAICHLETPLSPTNADLSYFPVFNVPYQVADALAGAGYDSCSTASNHSLDLGEAGVAGTLEVLGNAGIEGPGTARSQAEADRTVILDANGVEVAHLSYTYGFNGGELPPDRPWLANVIDTTRIRADAAAHRAAGAEFVVVSMHWGSQYQREPTDEQRQQARELLGSPDIDLILGHHVHVVQPIERVGDKYVVYGLGNFLSNQSPETCPSECPPGVEDGMIVTVTVTEDAAGELRVSDIGYTPTWVDRSAYTIVPTVQGLDAAAADESLRGRLEASEQRTTEAVGLLGGP